jgi:hypothetical protein
LNSNQAPILVGPWRSELGFEVSYWTPFLKFLAAHVKEFARRASVVTRGGLAPLYSQTCASSADLYSIRDVKVVRRENLYDQRIRQAGKTIKQVQITDWDEAVLEDAASALGIRLFHSLHPAWMYWALSPYWDEQASLSYLLSMTDYTPLSKIPVQGGLPPQYVAVKFYGRATFPYPHPDIATYVQETVAKLAQVLPVVSIGTGNEHDDHVDIPVVGKNIYTLPPDLPAEENLKAQAAVISQATAFVGTYGGVAQLALRLGVPSYSVYAQWGGTSHAHYALSSWLSKQMRVPFVATGLLESGTDGPATFAKQMVKARERGLASS